jgi:hypothetical protein
MGNKLYVPSADGKTKKVKQPYMEVNGKTKKVKKIYWEKDGKTVLIWPTNTVEGTFLKHFTLSNRTVDFEVILEG